MKMFFGIKIPEQFNTMLNLDIPSTKKTVEQIKEEISEKISVPKDEIDLLFRGNVLEDSDDISEFLPNSLILVSKKTKKYQPYASKKVYTAEDCKNIAELFGTITNVGINVAVRINILAHIISEYPEFRRNLGAQSLIRDSVLFHSLDNPKVIEKVAENYSIICDAAEFIVKITKKELAKNSSVNFLRIECDESLSDTTSSSEEENSTNANQSEQSRIRQISRHQLQAALSAIESAGSSNSLLNIARRVTEQQQLNRAEREGVNNNGTDSGSRPSSTIQSTNVISQSLLNNALTQALGQTSATSTARPSTVAPLPTIEIENMDTTENNRNNSSSSSNLPVDYTTHEYASQLIMMREMGLANDEINLNALIITNGDVGNAVNLVLSNESDYPRAT